MFFRLTLTRGVGLHLVLALLLDAPLAIAAKQGGGSSAAASDLRVQQITVPESRIRVIQSKTGQTSMGSMRIRALVMGDPMGLVSRPTLVINGASAQDREYCVDIVLINQLYSLSFTFFAKPNTDVYQVQFHSKSWAAQMPLRSGEVSVRVSPKVQARCDGPLLPAGWESNDLNASTWAYFNGIQSNGARAQITPAAAKPCKPVGGFLPGDPQATHFNYLCEIPLQSNICGEEALLQIQRDLGARSDPDPDHMKVRLACSPRRN